MNKIYGLNIDMLRLCYEIKEPNNINIIRTREIGEEVDFLYFYLSLSFSSGIIDYFVFYWWVVNLKEKGCL